SPLVICLCAACASGEVQPTQDEGGVDLLLIDALSDADFGEADFTDVGPDLDPDISCTLGTPAHCAHCDDHCPGEDSDTVQRDCIDGQCALACRGEHYDVNGDITDGCEITDDLPMHASEKDAVDLGSVTDCSLTQTMSATMPSDGRLHVAVPHERPNGRADYYSIHVRDDWACDLLATVRLDLDELSPEAEYRITTHYFCDNATPTAPRVTSGEGGSSFTNLPNTSCNPFGWGNDSGTLLIKIEKLSGPHEGASYSLSVLP
ncbi:MAG: hypothetical protein JRH20_09745, partial [Deltaproteobacteria bacterium]|nr:hypothetical protein [Deltaproteobacteria bacterium]